MSKVKVLIVEDDSQKCSNISDAIADFFGDAVIDRAETLAESTSRIYQNSYDLIVVDLLLPRRKGDHPTDISDEIIEHLAESELNKLTTTIAISKFEDVVDKRRDDFVRAGILLICYGDDNAWLECLRLCMQKVSLKTFYDFVIVCALSMERTAFEAVGSPSFSIGHRQSLFGLDARECTINQLRGVCLIQPQMGLVDSSIISTKALERFNPRLLCMSGICAGFEGRAELGTLIVSEYSWDHQAGKHVGDKFELRGYQQGVDSRTRIVLSQLLEEDPSLISLASKQYELPVPSLPAKLAPSVSGSAVIASSQFAEDLKSQHGKVAAVDMEVYGLYRAAALHGADLHYFAAKTVVDHATEEKGDVIQQAGAILSARFVVKAIERILG